LHDDDGLLLHGNDRSDDGLLMHGDDKAERVVASLLTSRTRVLFFELRVLVVKVHTGHGVYIFMKKKAPAYYRGAPYIYDVTAGVPDWCACGMSFVVVHGGRT
jgi:hypothetical protein